MNSSTQSKKKKSSDKPSPGSIEYLYGMSKDEYKAGLNTMNIKKAEDEELQKKIDQFLANGRSSGIPQGRSCISQGRLSWI